MISFMSHISDFKKVRSMAFVALVLFLLIAPGMVTLAQSSDPRKPAPKGTPPRVIVPPKSEREKSKENEKKEERPRRP